MSPVRLLLTIFAVTVFAGSAHGAKKIPGGVYARHALGIDATTGEVLFAKNDSYVVPIASITKLMTALVVRERGASMDSVVTTTRALRRRAGRIRLKVGESIRSLTGTGGLSGRGRGEETEPDEAS